VSVSDCPTPAELAGLVEGLLSGGDLERVAAHVDHCPACLAAAQEYRPTDVVVSALRRGAPPCAPPAAPGQRYAPLYLRAAGGLGEVHVAEDTELGRKVALKRIRPGRADDPDSRRRFLREAEITARLEHPGVVPVHGLVWDAAGRPHYAMRLIEGESLHEAIKAFHAAEGPDRDAGERALALRGLLGRFVAVCQTVAYAHSRGVVHRDIKPSNVMLGRYGETLVVDWGLAKSGDRGQGTADCADTARGVATRDGAQDPSGSSVTDGTPAGAVVGTPGYMSPEQAAGRHDEVGPASDIYMLGGTLFTILTGRPPSRGESKEPLSRSVPPPLRAVCLKAMAARPADRYATATELGAEVERWLAGEPVRAYPERWPARAARWARRHRVAVGGLAVGLLVAAVLGGGGGVWLAREAADRRGERARLQAKDHDAVGQALAALPELVGAWRFPEAVLVLEQTSVGLSEFAPAEDRTRLADALTDVRLAHQLNTIRLEKTTEVENKVNTPAAVVPEYRAAFERHGVNTADEVEAVGRRVAASPVREALVAALDDWAANESDAGRRDRVTRIAKAADPDPWRDRFRDALARRDRPALRTLAAEADVARLSPAALVALGLALDAKSREAADVLERAHVHHPADYWLNFWLVGALRHNGRIGPVEALSYYRVCVLARPNAATAHHNLGSALQDAGNNPGAELAYRRALELDPKLVPSINNLGNILGARGDVAGAEDAYRQALELDPTFVAARCNLGTSLLLKRGKRDEAEAEFRRALAIDPNYAVAHFSLGNVLLHRGDRSGAEVEFRRAIECDPGLAVAHYNLGNTLRERGNLAGAEAEYRRVTELEPKNAAAHTNLGAVLFMRGNSAAAEKALRKAIEIEPKHVRAHLNLGNLLGDRGDYAGAEASYRRAIEADPAFPPGHFQLGYVLIDRGDRAGAAASFRRATELDPGNAAAHDHLGTLLLEEGDFSGAEAAHRRVIELQPGNFGAHDNLAAALLGLGRFDDARAAARRALDLFPPGQPAHDPAARRLQQAEQMLKLDSRLPAVLRGEDRPADLTEHATFAGLAAVRRRHAGAVRLYEELFRKDPTAAGSKERRYNAACSAALAGCGQGDDDPAPGADERARFRRRAIDWLRADLKVRVAALAAADPKARGAAGRALRHWQADPDLGGVRDAPCLEALPADERDAWRLFWADVAAALGPDRK
jgi:tetratricopeptide (TPR) repeat protein/tRNA A-37 threonylcarbamoyl transferase component Bud32